MVNHYLIMFSRTGKVHLELFGQSVTACGRNCFKENAKYGSFPASVRIDTTPLTAPFINAGHDQFCKVCLQHLPGGYDW